MLPELARGKGNGLGVIAHGRGNDLIAGHAHDLIERPSHLEGTGLLEIFKLEIQVGPGQLAEGAGMDERSLMDVLPDRASGGLDVFYRDHGIFSPVCLSGIFGSGLSGFVS
jgi:hypothetical protein